MLTEALVIKKTPAREHDLLVTLYTRGSGKLSAIAKGAMKPKSVQALQLDPGNLIHCELVPGRGGMPIITGAQAFRCYSGAKSAPSALAAVQFFLHVVDAAVFDQEQDESLWDCLNGIMADLEKTPRTDLLVSFRRHQLALLSTLGYGEQAADGIAGPGRTPMDDKFEQLAGRKLHSLDLFYELAK